MIYLKPQISSKHNFVNLYLTSRFSLIISNNIAFHFFQINSAARAFLILNGEL